MMVTYPLKIPISVAPGQVLVHNHVRPARRQGTRGFRFWLQKAAALVVICDCGWAPALPEHYRDERALAHKPASQRKVATVNSIEQGKIRPHPSKLDVAPGVDPAELPWSCHPRSECPTC